MVIADRFMAVVGFKGVTLSLSLAKSDSQLCIPLSLVN